MVDAGIKGFDLNKISYTKYLNKRTVGKEIEYKTYRNKLHHILKITKATLLRIIDQLPKWCKKQNTEIIENIVIRNKSRQLQTKFKLNDGNFTTDGSIISNTFNDFFINIGPSLAGNIPNMGVSSVQLNSTQNIFIE